MQPQADREAEVSQKPWPLPSTPETSMTSPEARAVSLESAPPESVPSVSSDNTLASQTWGNQTWRSQDEIAQAVLGLLTEMEASLEASQKAVLTSDGRMLENCTREQVRLYRALEPLLRLPAWPGTAGQKADKKNVRPAEPGCPPALAAEVLAAQQRVRHGARVQAALLRRARQFRRILANFAAAQGATYGAWFEQNTFEELAFGESAQF